MSPPNEEYVLDLLRDAGLVTRPQIEEARANLDGSTRIVELLVRQGIVADDDVSRSFAAQTQMQWIDLADMVVPPEVIDEIKPEDARRFKMIPIARNENSLVVPTGDPLDFDSIDGLSFLLKREIDLVCTTLSPAYFYYDKLYCAYLGQLLQSAKCPILALRSV